MDHAFLVQVSERQKYLLDYELVFFSQAGFALKVLLEIAFVAVFQNGLRFGEFIPALVIRRIVE